MKTKKPKLPTAQSQLQFDNARARMLDAFSDPDNMPSARIRAALDFRYNGMVATGYDSLSAREGTYHLTTDFAAPVARLCRTLAGEDDYLGFGTARKKAVAVVETLAWLLGYRWSRGVENLDNALQASGVPMVQVTLYSAERKAARAVLARLLDATQAMLDARQPDTALLNAAATLTAAAEEVGRLAYWLNIAGDKHRAAAARASYGEALDYLAECGVQHGKGSKRQRR